MFLTLKTILLSPRLWLSAGVFSLGMSIVVGYHQDQIIAESALAQKVELPSKVMVQNFSGDLHENLLSEVHILAEAAIDRLVRVDLGNETTPRLVEIVPLYPVSRAALPIAESLISDRRRPQPRDRAFNLDAYHRMLARLENFPMALMVFEIEEGKSALDTAEFDQFRIGDGINGPLVSVTGLRIGATAILQQASGPMAANGVRLVDEILVVSPHLNGRLGGPEITDYSTVRNTLVWASLLIVGVGLALLFSPLPLSKKAKRKDVTYEVKAVGAFPAVDPFQPIRTQEELHSDDKRRTSSVLTSAAETFRARSRP